MSIFSAIHAEHSEEKKQEWLKELKTAFEKKEWILIEKLIKKMEDFYFSE